MQINMNTKTSIIALILITIFYNRGSAATPQVDHHWSVSAKLEPYNDPESKIISDREGNCYITGRIPANNTNFVFLGKRITNLSRRDGSVWVAKVDRFGNLKWAISPESTGYSEGRSIAADREGNIFVSGSYAYKNLSINGSTLQEPQNNSTDGFVLKLSPTGTVLWAKRFGGSSSEYPGGIALDLEGNCVVAGSFYSDSINFDSTLVNRTGLMDAFIAKYTPSGSVAWARGFGSKSFTGPNSIAIDSSNNIYLCGWFEGAVTFDGKTINAGAAPARNPFLVKFNSQGIAEWAEAGAGLGGSSYGGHVAINSANQPYLAGFFESDKLSFGNIYLTKAGANQNCFLAKFDVNGTPLWAKSTRNSNYAISTGLGIDSDGSAYLVGYYGGNSIDFDSLSLTNNGNSDGFLVKYSNSGVAQWGRVLGGIGGDMATGVAVQDIDRLFVSGSFRSPDVALGSTHLSSGMPINEESSSFFLTRIDDQKPQPRAATAVALVVNGFIVSVTIRDPGFGYTTNPVVTFSSEQGDGAKASAIITSSRVSNIKILNTGNKYISPPLVTISPPPMPPRKAAALASIINGFVVDITIIDGGSGYESPPVVYIFGGGGLGATAVASIEGGVVNGFKITNAGNDYKTEPNIEIANPLDNLNNPFLTPKLSIDVTSVRVNMDLIPGNRYQLQASKDLQAWFNVGETFVPQTRFSYQDFNTSVFGQYFRIVEIR
jgi:hypothetical protein